ncbi:hypothetical protein [Stutzerimonas kunmingensis]|uniref:hypothetical protein n=1 Tax=Stutzerimonas kunmingensis TaxID=1211807 RepID=UPI001F2AB89D|nr:hypothetical protein [Stutzerimonas kunmingensis]UIP34545.1 hypothetical protein LW136_08970 [Stutzerimonas kunmingensis]
MTQILIAAFDRYAEAEKVKAELVSEGVSSDDIQISASFNSDTVDSSRVEVVGEEPGEDATVADKIGSFFHKVFGDGSSQHAGRYPEAARRGSTIVTVTLEDDVTVTLEDDSRVSAVERVMERNGAIDIDERSAKWGDDDATPVTASTETLTTGYPDATSISVDERELDGSSTPDRGADLGSIPGRAENEKAARRDNTAGRVRIIPR